MIVLVESHTDARAPRTARAVPDAGARWGRASRFGFDRSAGGQSAEDAEMERRGGITIIRPAERIETVEVNDFTPVWRKIRIVKLWSSEDPMASEEVGITSELLFPLGESRQKYVSSVGDYLEDTGGKPYEERIIHTFLLLRVPSPVPLAEILRVEEEGEWPDLPEEMFPPGKFVNVPPMGDWHR